MTSDPLFLRTADVLRLTGFSRTTLWRLERAGKFPRRRQLAPNIIGWATEEISRWAASLSAAEQVENAGGGDGE